MLRIVAAVVIALTVGSLTAPAGAGPDQIETLQWRLLFLGYDVGRTDGLMSEKTHEAIRAFERDQGLPETGEPTEALSDLTKKEWERRRDAEWETLRE